VSLLSQIRALASPFGAAPAYGYACAYLITLRKVAEAEQPCLDSRFTRRGGKRELAVLVFGWQVAATPIKLKLTAKLIVVMAPGRQFGELDSNLGSSLPVRPDGPGRAYYVVRPYVADEFGQTVNSKKSTARGVCASRT
jgi:hypothetical protein